MEIKRYVGVMSGTSLDGIDVVLLAIPEGGKPYVEFSHSEPLPDSIIQQVQALLSAPQSLAFAGELSVSIATAFATAVNTLVNTYEVNRETVTAIGCHGLTVWHQPYSDIRFSSQLVEASYLAQLTGIDVVTDFRNMDMAVGGQGAPLVPGFHALMLEQDAIWVNIGGIANLSVIEDSQVFGYDSGPGNTLLNHFCLRHFECAFDAEGQIAESGQLDQDLLTLLLDEPYFNLVYPKSTGKELFNLEWLDARLKSVNKAILHQDVLCTLTHLTAKSIASELNRFKSKLVVVSGGGLFNRYMMDLLAHYAADKTIVSSVSVGIDPQQVEAAAFAWLAHCRINSIPSNCPSVTGANKKVILGAWYKGQAL